MKNNIELKNVSKVYKEFTLKDITFNVPEGAIVGFIGENGVGKTTTIKSILNIISYDGEIKVFGKDVKTNEGEIKEDIGVVLDDSFISDYLNVKQVERVVRKFYKNWSSEEFYGYIEEFKLPLKKAVKDFSSGMKMKLKIAIALSHSPKLLILDEPTSGLDPIVRNELLDIFRDYIAKDETRSILMSTHITSDLEHIADYIVFINKGKVIFDKPMNELFENYGIVKCSEEDLKSFDKKDYVSFIKNKYDCEVLISNRKEFTEKYDVKVIDKPSIEDIMVLYVKGVK